MPGQGTKISFDRHSANMAGGEPGRSLLPFGHRALGLCVPLLWLLASLDCVASQGALGWHFSAWGECDKSCGGGTQYRHAHCLDRYGQIAILDLVCGVPPAAEETSRTCNTEPCGYFYQELAGWSMCSSACGYGWRTRSTTCMAEGVPLPDSEASLCDGNSEVPLGEYCNTAPCPDDVSLWVVGSWQSCSTECGPGTSNRTVECQTLSGALSESCAGPKPAASIPCEATPCNSTLCERCGTHTASCSTMGVCTCEAGWHGPRCTVRSECVSGVLDHDGICCPSGVLDLEGLCCAAGPEGSPPTTTDRYGRCCPPEMELDACGVCGGDAVTVDVRGECCSGPLDAAGYCCASTDLDPCGVCGGNILPGPVGSSVCPEAVCGDGVCSMEESAWRRGANRCQEDCPLQLFDCPKGANPSLGTSTYTCSGRGSCLVSQGDCSCIHGYGGEACSQCIAGWEPTASGSCIPVPQSRLGSSAGDRPTAIPLPPPSPTTVPPEEERAFPTWAIMSSAAGGAVVLLVVILLLCLLCCRRDFGTGGLQLYPADPVYMGDDTVLCQSTFFTPGEPLRRPFPEEAGWEPLDPKKSLNPNLYGGKRPPFVPAVISARTDNGGHLLNLPPLGPSSQKLRSLRSLEQDFGVALHTPSLLTTPLPGSVELSDSMAGLLVPPRPGAGLFVARPVSSRPSSVQIAGRPPPGQQWQPAVFGTGRPVSQPTTQQLHQHVMAMRPASAEAVLRSSAAARPRSPPRQWVPRLEDQPEPMYAFEEAPAAQEANQDDTAAQHTVRSPPEVPDDPSGPPSPHGDGHDPEEKPVPVLALRPKSRYIRRSTLGLEEEDPERPSSSATARPASHSLHRVATERPRTSMPSRSRRRLPSGRVNFCDDEDDSDGSVENSRRGSTTAAAMRKAFGGVSGFFGGQNSVSKRSFRSSAGASRRSMGGNLGMQSFRSRASKTSGASNKSTAQGMKSTFRSRLASRFEHADDDDDEDSDDVSMAGSLTHVPLPSVFNHTFAPEDDMTNSDDSDDGFQAGRWHGEGPKDTAGLAKLSASYWVGDAPMGPDMSSPNRRSVGDEPSPSAPHRPHVRHAGRIRFDEP